MTNQSAFSRIASRVLLYGVVIILSVGYAGPLIWMVSTSLKTDPQVYTVPPIWIPNPMRFVNYPEAVHFSYKRFLINQIRVQAGLDKTPIRILFRQREGRKQKKSKSRRKQKQ